MVAGSPPCKGTQTPESWKFLLVEFGNLGFGIRNITNDWNLEFKFQYQSLESSSRNPESTAWNPQFKTFLISHTWGEAGVIFCFVC